MQLSNNVGQRLIVRPTRDSRRRFLGPTWPAVGPDWDEAGRRLGWEEGRVSEPQVRMPGEPVERQPQAASAVRERLESLELRMLAVEEAVAVRREEAADFKRGPGVQLR